jgi:hypothetical protein
LVGGYAARHGAQQPAAHRQPVSCDELIPEGVTSSIRTPLYRRSQHHIPRSSPIHVEVGVDSWLRCKLLTPAAAQHGVPPLGKNSSSVSFVESTAATNEASDSGGEIWKHQTSSPPCLTYGNDHSSRRGNEDAAERDGYQARSTGTVRDTPNTPSIAP